MSRTTGIAIALAILLLGAAGYLLFRPDAGAGVTATGAPASSAELTFITLTARINPVELDTSILEDERFKGLQDMRTTILPEPSGRFDPFAPL